MAGKKRSRWLSWFLTALLLALAIRNTDLRSAWLVIESSRIGWVLEASLLALFGLTAMRTLRARAILKPLARHDREPGLRKLFSLLAATRFLNLIFPAPAGEALRISGFHRAWGIPLESALAAVATETAIDVALLALLTAVLLTLGLFPVLPEWHFRPALGLPLLALGLVLLVLILRWRPQVARALWAVFRSPSGWFAIAYTLIIDLLDVSIILACMHAVGIPPDWVVALFVLLAVNLAIAIPTPGNLGTLEAGAVFALQSHGVTPARALAFAVLYHLAHLLPAIIWGSSALPVALRIARGFPPRHSP